MHLAPCHSQYTAFLNDLQPDEGTTSLLEGYPPRHGSVSIPEILRPPIAPLWSTTPSPHDYEANNQFYYTNRDLESFRADSHKHLPDNLGIGACSHFHFIEVFFETLKSCRDSTVPGILKMASLLFNILPCHLCFLSVYLTPHELLDNLHSNQSTMTDRIRH